jgi:class 3 adenylate cyclase
MAATNQHITSSDLLNQQWLERIIQLAEQLVRSAPHLWVAESALASLLPETEHSAPDLYDALDEAERARAVARAVEALRAVVALGHELEPQASHREEEPEAEEPNIVLEQLAQSSAGNLGSLLALWRARKTEQWARYPNIYRILGKRILDLGEPILAYDVLNEGLEYWPADVRMRQLNALALSRSGATDKANVILFQLYQEGHTDEETLGLLARTHKDLWQQSNNPEEQQRQLQQSFGYYFQAYQLNRGYYTGINAATVALLANNTPHAHTIAEEVHQMCMQEYHSSPDAANNYWLTATLAEAALIHGDIEEAGQWYSRAAQLGSGKYGNLNSTRRNAWLILDHLQLDRRTIDQYFQFPTVVVFAGHMIDRPDRPIPRFPPELEGAVKQAIRERLIALNCGIGYSSLACGADILFQEAVLELGGESHVVLPYNRKNFIEDSVGYPPDGNWEERFDRICHEATEVQTASLQKMMGGSMSFEYTNLLLHGLASIRSEQLQTRLAPLAVWDGGRGDGVGGTASSIEHWWFCGRHVELIHLRAMLEQVMETHVMASLPDEPPATPADDEEDDGLRAEMIGMLFADAVSFSKLTEEELPLFIRTFLGEIGDLVNNSNHKPIMRNTWGDGLYLVFPDVRSTGLFALQLYERICTVDWSTRDLPATLNLRIALHAGPVYSCIDPVTGNPNYIGSQVSHAARIEPVTPPGQVYASQAFAALAAAQRVTEFTCDYVGQTPLAKEHGTFPTYLVRRNVSG